jgi:hypothetical protein
MDLQEEDDGSKDQRGYHDYREPEKNCGKQLTDFYLVDHHLPILLPMDYLQPRQDAF